MPYATTRLHEFSTQLIWLPPHYPIYLSYLAQTFFFIKKNALTPLYLRPCLYFTSTLCRPPVSYNPLSIAYRPYFCMSVTSHPLLPASRLLSLTAFIFIFARASHIPCHQAPCMSPVAHCSSLKPIKKAISLSLVATPHHRLDPLLLFSLSSS